MRTGMTGSGAITADLQALVTADLQAPPRSRDVWDIAGPPHVDSQSQSHRGNNGLLHRLIE